MTILLFSVTPTAVGQIYDILCCLAKFDENVSFEATPQHLRLSGLNIAKTAHAAFTLDSSFFLKFHFSSDRRGDAAATNSWSCKLSNKVRMLAGHLRLLIVGQALAAVFSRRHADTKNKDTALQHCEFELLARADETECRLIFRLVCNSGVVKTYRLYYETGEILHATFDEAASVNHWSASSRTLRDVVEYFGTNTDQLDWYSKDDKVTFTSYTEKVQNGKEILKQPMHTSVALERKDFGAFNVQENLHIGSMVKDFRAIVTHAETMHAEVTARYSKGNRPMQISYGLPGLSAEFTLMTRPTATNVPNGTRTGTPARDLSVRAFSQARSIGREGSALATTQSPSEMPPPTSRPSERQLTIPPSRVEVGGRNSPPPPTASLNPDSLFIPAEEDESQWDEPDYSERADIVTWDNDSAFASAATSSRRIADSDSGPTSNASEGRTGIFQEIAPTQRLSQITGGLFD